MTIHTNISRANAKDIIVIYGYQLSELLKEQSYEEISYLLINKKLPTKDELFEFNYRGLQIREMMAQNIHVRQQIFLKPHTVLQSLAASIVDYLTPWDYMNQVLMSFYSFFCSPINAAVNYELQLYLLLSSSGLDEECLDAFRELMILYSEYPNSPSTIVVRMLSSHRVAMPNAISAAIGCASGARHAGALNEIPRFFFSLELYEYQRVIDRAISQKERIPGFGHLVCKEGDPRSDIAYEIAHRLAQKKTEYQKKLLVAKTAAGYLAKNYGLHPNVDYYAAYALSFLGCPQDLFSVFFCFARLPGWVAHYLEQEASLATIMMPIQSDITPEESL